MNELLVVKDLREQVRELSAQLSTLGIQHAAMKQERDFWTEQARSLQNQLQIVYRTQGDIMKQMAHSAVCPDDVHAAIAQMAEELRRPLTTVAAVEALAAAARDGTQGAYTAVDQSSRKQVASW